MIRPGIAEFDGSDWGNLTLANIIMGAVNTWDANGQSNAAWKKPPAFDDIDYIKSLADTADMSQLNGLIQIPVCSAEEIYNFFSEQMPEDPDALAYFPCPVPA